MSTDQQAGSVPFSRAPQEPVALADVAVLLHPEDDVAIAKAQLAPGTVLVLPDGPDVRLEQAIPLRPQADAQSRSLRRADPSLRPGHRHRHRADSCPAATSTPTTSRSERSAATTAFGATYAPVDFVPEAERRTFMGFRRADGRVGTRNYVAVLASVNCSSSATVPSPSGSATRACWRDYPNVDGVIALPHKGGCGAHIGSRRRSSSCSARWPGTVDHPNVAGYVDPQPWLRGQSAGRHDRGHRPRRRRARRAHDPAGRWLREDGRGRESRRSRRLLPIANQASASRSRRPSSCSRCSAVAPTVGRA